MSTKGNAESYIELRGSLSLPDAITGKSAYEIAVMNGFEGTEKEWLESLHNGAKGDPGKDGVGIQSITQNSNGALVITLTDGNVRVFPLPTTGESGSSGTGADGVGISNIEINASGELVVTLTSGAVYNLGVVVGADGKDGNDYVLTDEDRAEIADIVIAALPRATVYNGEIVIGKEIQFTVNGKAYTATEGMTWVDWVDSEYNTDGFVVCESYGASLIAVTVYEGDDGEGEDEYVYDGDYIRSDATIISGYDYSVST